MTDVREDNAQVCTANRKVDSDLGSLSIKCEFLQGHAALPGNSFQAFTWFLNIRYC